MKERKLIERWEIERKGIKNIERYKEKMREERESERERDEDIINERDNERVREREWKRNRNWMLEIVRERERKGKEDIK